LRPAAPRSRTASPPPAPRRPGGWLAPGGRGHGRDDGRAPERAAGRRQLHLHVHGSSLPAAGAAGQVTMASPRVADRDLDGLLVRVHYPAEGGPLPVIVFSHGVGGSRLGYVEACTLWFCDKH